MNLILNPILIPILNQILNEIDFLAIFFVPKIFGPKIVLVPKFLDQKYLDLDSFGPNFFEQKQQQQ